LPFLPELSTVNSVMNPPFPNLCLTYAPYDD
jgi:hypothetical protein